MAKITISIGLLYNTRLIHQLLVQFKASRILMMSEKVLETTRRFQTVKTELRAQVGHWLLKDLVKPFTWQVRVLSNSTER